VNDLTPTQEQGRRAYFNRHGVRPRKGSNPQAERYTVTFERAAPTPYTPAPTPVPPKSPERAAWDNAYSGPEVGPLGGSWPEDGRHIPRMVWRLPLHSHSRKPPTNLS
jgi:hypothetical protein